MSCVHEEHTAQGKLQYIYLMRTGINVLTRTWEEIKLELKTKGSKGLELNMPSKSETINTGNKGRGMSGKRNLETDRSLQ